MTQGIRLSELVGKGFGDFWHFKGRYRVVKGSRASKKSKTTALWFITHLMRYPDANLLVVRKVYRTLSDSCFKELRWAIARLGVRHLWHIRESPLEMRYIPTGQTIYFRGLDDPLKVTSVTVEVGSLCWLWLEEAYEVSRLEDFETLDESIRGKVAPPLFKQVTLTFNPWNAAHWLKARFFDEADPDVLAKTVDYRCNEWIDDADLKVFERMAEHNPRRYKVAGLGEWGTVEGLIYENWTEHTFDHTSEEWRKEHPRAKSAFGLDFGYTNDPSALFCGLIDEESREIYVFDELYRRGLVNREIAEAVIAMGYGKERIIADQAEPKSIAELSQYGLSRVWASRKGKGSVLNGIQFIQGYRLVVHPRCVNFATELANYGWQEDRFGHKVNEPAKDFNHLMDAMRYALEGFIIGDAFSFD